MITFQGNKELLKSAKLLESNSRNLYPHLSTSRVRKIIGYDVENDPKFFSEMKKEYTGARKMIRESGDYYAALVYSLMFGRVGNCTEDSMLTELLGKINGQKNIYTGSLGLKQEDKSGAINHVVAFITDKPLTAGKEEFFKNKEAIIIDPWLGITDFAGSYFTKLKTIYRKVFMQENNKRFVTFSDDNLVMELLKSMSNTTQEFKANRKEFCPTVNISITPFIDNSFNEEKIESIKETFPNLVLKGFKKILLPEKEEKTGKKDMIA